MIAALVSVALLGAQPIPSAAAPAASPTRAADAAGSAIMMPLTKETLSLVAVTLDKATLTESLTAYGNPADPLLPLSELARLLELDVQVMPSELRVTGRIGEGSRTLLIDLAKGLARIGVTQIALPPRSAGTTPTDVYLAASQIQKLLPLKIDINTDDQIVNLIATQLLPIQARRARQGRLYTLGDLPSATEQVLNVATPYRWAGLPAFDFSIGSENDNARGGLARRYEVRAAADVLKTSFTGYIGSDDRGRLVTARARFERRSAAGDLLGPLHATYAGAGDIYTPTLSLGPRGSSGVGVAFSTGRTEDTNVFQRITLRGELPVGYDVELYINDVLRSGQSSPVEGRYEFLNVPLTRGVNVIRVVTYGPHGERNEQTRVINVGGGQLEPGRTLIDGGIAAQDRPLVQFPDGEITTIGNGHGALRATLSVAYGISTSLTGNVGFGLFTDSSGYRHGTGTVGARTSLLGMATQLDLAHDLHEGSAASLGAAGKLFGVNFLARHVEYRGNFLDETNALVDIARPLHRYSSADLDWTTPFLWHTTLPLAAHIETADYVNGGISWIARGRSAITVANTLVAIGADFQTMRLDGVTTRTFTGNVSASRFIDYKWQLRGSLDYDLTPRVSVRALALTVDRAIGSIFSARVGVAKAFGLTRDVSTQLGVTARFAFGDASTFAEYSTDQRRFRIGVQLNFGLAFDPLSRRYRMTRPGPASGGSASMLSFLDRNANGRFDDGDEPVPGIRIQGADRAIVTDKSGHAFVTGLGQSPTAMLHADLSNTDTVFVSTPPQNISLSPRAGRVAEILYPMVPTSEINLKLRFRQADGSLAGLAAVHVRLVPEKGSPVAAATEFDGTVVFEDVRPGRYRIELDTEQAERLHMRLSQPITAEIGADGRPQMIVREILFEKAKAQ